MDLKSGTETYAFALFTLEDFDAIINRMGYKASQKSVKTMGAYINRRFGAMGGFSARRSINQFGTVLPYSDIDEAGRLLERFITDLQKEGLAEIEAAAKTENPSLEGVKFSILAGLASGKPDVELQEWLEFCNVQGIIFHDAKTCPYNTNSRFAMPSRLNAELGIPTLIIDGDLNDLRCFSEEQAKTNIEAFVEQLEEIV